jgi:hypothetical protein
LKFYFAGRLDSNIRQSGEILINGHKQALAYGTSVREKKKEKEIIHPFSESRKKYISSRNEANINKTLIITLISPW